MNAPESSGLLIVVESIERFSQQLVSLSQSIPRPIVLPVHILQDHSVSSQCNEERKGRGLTDSTSITCDRSIRILDLDVFVSHQRPRR